VDEILLICNPVREHVVNWTYIFPSIPDNATVFCNLNEEPDASIEGKRKTFLFNVISPSDENMTLLISLHYPEINVELLIRSTLLSNVADSNLGSQILQVPSFPRFLQMIIHNIQEAHLAS
jgi:hypothetical protein